MSAAIPPAAEVASINTRPSPIRSTGAAAPVEVSFCAHATTSASSWAGRTTAPGSHCVTAGSARNGAAAAARANLRVNSPKTACAERRSIREQTATSQNTVDPPLPSTTWYPSGSRYSSRSPS